MNLNLPSSPILTASPSKAHCPPTSAPPTPNSTARAASSTSGSSSRGRSACPWPAAKPSSASTRRRAGALCRSPCRRLLRWSCTGSAGIRSTPTSSPSRPGSATTATFPCPSPAPPASSSKTGPEGNHAYIQVDWHRYPGQTLHEPRRFCARWRREMPTQSYGEEYLMLDADGPGQLLGFVYGVRLLDDTDRWSHGGAENIYIDGEGEHPRLPARHRRARTPSAPAMAAPSTRPKRTTTPPCPTTSTTTSAKPPRPAPRRLPLLRKGHPALPQRHSHALRLHGQRHLLTTYWYQQGPVRPFFTMPDWPQLLPGVELPPRRPRLPPPRKRPMVALRPLRQPRRPGHGRNASPQTAFDPDATYDGLHRAESAWLTEGSRQHGRDRARWHRRAAHHGFIDFKPPLPPLGPRRRQDRHRHSPRPLHPPRALRHRSHTPPRLGRRPDAARQ